VLSHKRPLSVSLPSTVSASKEAVLQEKEFNASAKEGLDGLFRRIDNGLTLYVETGVEHHFSSGGFSDGGEQAMEIGIVFF
jgi:hypothetical protein